MPPKMNEKGEPNAAGSSRRGWEKSILNSAIGAPQDRGTLSEWAADRLRALILDGHLPPGMPLRPDHLAERFGISVMPVREALRILAADDLVTISPRRGATVRGMSADDVEESFAVRGALEALAGRLATANLSDDDISRLGSLVEQLRSACAVDDLSAFLKYDREFHSILYSASSRPQLATRIMGLWDSLRRVYDLAESVESANMQATMSSHEAILHACESGDANAVEAAVREHTEEAAQRIVPVLRQRTPASTD